MRIALLRHLGFLLFALGLFMISCSPFGAGTQRQTQYYVLSSLQSESVSIEPLADLSGVGIGVGPIRMPLYLDRSDIVTRGSSNQVEIADFAQWAGPLPENFSRVLAENLSVLLATDKVGIFPFVRRQMVDFYVTVYVTRFDGEPGDRAHLRARWSILDKRRAKSFYEKHTVTSHPTIDGSTEALIAAKSSTVSDLSREIAEALWQVAQNHPPKKKG
ncbi:hypothetical protein D1AOALGA4SA_1444 [Olavius algarvensis Delta 1 endosymbiont]|nr:hypothetical protein D1AOALGA4SA_1444 [Olavius algarvensis Delta 1 endosymbiont]